MASKDDNPSFVLEKPLSVNIANRPSPTLTSPHDVLVRIAYTGICGSDVHYWQHGRIGHFIVKSPMVLGHESAGVVSAIGDSVTTLKVGDRVALEPGVPCRRCPYCKAGAYNLCVAMAFAATPPFDGTLCRTYKLPADFCYKLPEKMSLKEGALIEPLSVAVHISKQAGIKPGDSVVVFGAGPVGLLCLAVAKAFGATKIVTVDINADRVKFAMGYAATASFQPQKGESPEETGKRMVKELGFEEMGGADVAIDASGAEVCIQTAIHVLRTGGSYVQGGMGKSDISFPIMAMCTKELKMSGSFRYGSGDYKLAVELVANGTIDVKKLITNQFKFEEAEKAFEETKAAKGIKILIEGPDWKDDE